MHTAFHGLLNVHKPPGITSRRVVDRVLRLARPAKVGHAGTLDPLAEGVLVVCVGGATRLIEFVQRQPKSYTGVFLLGRRSDTEDVEGTIELLSDPPQPTRQQLDAAAQKLTGAIQQRPPAYSALKVEGRRAYDLARAGHDVQLAPRPVTIYRLEIERYEYPELTLSIECSSGTYVRSLGRDLAESVGTAAVMSALVRTAIGGFQLNASCSLEQLTEQGLSAWLLPPARAVENLPRLDLTSPEVAEIRHGRALPRLVAGGDSQWAAFNDSGDLLAVLARREDGSLGPVINLSAPTE